MREPDGKEPGTDLEGLEELVEEVDPGEDPEKKYPRVAANLLHRTDSDGLTGPEWRFAQEVASGKNAEAAGKAAGLTSSYSTTRMLRKKAVVDMIERLRAETAAELKISRERIALELARIGFADMRNVADWNSEGFHLRSSEELTEDAAAAIQEVKNEESRFGLKQGVKLGDKVKALTELARILGYSREEQLPGVTVLFPSMSQEDAAKYTLALHDRVDRIAAKAKALEAGKTDADE